MTYGKKVCNTLKEIRQQIADKNEIEYTTSECHFDEECKGTCPKCESEIKYLENELFKRKQLGQAVAIAGISLGIAGTFSAYNLPQQTNTSISAEQEMATDMENSDTISAISKDSIKFMPLDIIEDLIVEDVIKDKVFLFVGGIEQIPVFPGGEKALTKFLQKNIVYPKGAKEKGIEGEVVISFVVEQDGSLNNFKIQKSVHPLLDEEALRVVKIMPKWESGKEFGKNVSQRLSLPVKFVLYDGKKIKTKRHDTRKKSL